MRDVIGELAAWWRAGETVAVGTVVDSGMLPAARKRALESAVLSEAAVDERIELVLFALSRPEAPAPAPGKKTKKAPR